MVRKFGKNVVTCARESLWKFPFLVLASFTILLAACNNTCFVFVSNPPTGTIGIAVSNPPPTCRLTKANGAVRVVARTIPAGNSAPAPGQIQHIFVTLRGVDMHSGVVADSSSPDWQQLLPHLSGQPLQIDLLKGVEAPAAQRLLGEPTAIPAGAYRQLRVRFLANDLAADALPESNACGRALYNCVVSQGGQIQPLVFDRAAAELRITSDRIVNGSLLILPDSFADVLLAFDLSWSLTSSDREGIRLLPTLTGTASLESRGIPVSD